MWIPHGTGMLNLGCATSITIKPSHAGFCVIAMVAGAQAQLACYPTEQQAKEHLMRLQDRLNRHRGK